MAESISHQRLIRLQSALGSEPGAVSFPAVVEAHRRSGSLDVAERVARAGLARDPDSLEGRVALALVLLGTDRAAEARGVLEPALGSLLEIHGLLDSDAPDSHGLDAEVSDQELDLAFASAEAERDRMLDADDVAQRAMRQADRALAEELAARPDSAFATPTMAGLLERQGDVAGAARVRQAIEARSGARSDHDRIVATLESWLANLGRERV